jgi:[acyl-carrier-protein] S-malonyltransferase
MKLFFVFSGQGAQSVGMGKDLCEAFPVAKSFFDCADKVLGYSLSDVIFNGPAEKLTETRFCQSAIYTMSCASLAAFREKFPEAQPVAAAGLSLGEYAALFCGKAFTFEEGLKLLQKRADLMDECCRNTQGGMATALGCEAAVIEEACKNADVDVANYNSPGQIVISGEKEKVKNAVAELKGKGYRKVIELQVAGAFHSRLMAPAGKALAGVLAETELSLPEIPVYQNFTAAAPASVEEMKQNLASQVSGSVRWESCVRAAAAAGAEMMIEFGPGNVLTGLLKRTIPEMKSANINSAESLEKFQF